MFYVMTERFEKELVPFGVWDAESIIKEYKADDWHSEEILFESDSYIQAKQFFEYEKADCKTFLNGAFLKADVLCLYRDDVLLDIYANPLEK